MPPSEKGLYMGYTFDKWSFCGFDYKTMEAKFGLKNRMIKIPLQEFERFLREEVLTGNKNDTDLIGVDEQTKRIRSNKRIMLEAQKWIGQKAENNIVSNMDIVAVEDRAFIFLEAPIVKMLFCRQGTSSVSIASLPSVWLEIDKDSYVLMNKIDFGENLSLSKELPGTATFLGSTRTSRTREILLTGKGQKASIAFLEKAGKKGVELVDWSVEIGHNRCRGANAKLVLSSENEHGMFFKLKDQQFLLKFFCEDDVCSVHGVDFEEVSDLFSSGEEGVIGCRVFVEGSKEDIRSWVQDNGVEKCDLKILDQGI